LFKILFKNQEDVYEVYAKQIFQSDLHGFIEIEELLFGERSQVVVDPQEEKLKAEFADVKRSFIPMYSVIRIDEVEKQGTPKIRVGASGKINSVTPFPTHSLTPVE
jgi:hypothetical protein